MASCLSFTNEMRNGCYFKVLFFDRIYRINGILFACGEIPLGRRPYYPDDPVNPVENYFR
jgi:hypothetical protein